MESFDTWNRVGEYRDRLGKSLLVLEKDKKEVVIAMQGEEAALEYLSGRLMQDMRLPHQKMLLGTLGGVTVLAYEEFYRGKRETLLDIFHSMDVKEMFRVAEKQNLLSAKDFKRRLSQTLPLAALFGRDPKDWGSLWEFAPDTRAMLPIRGAGSALGVTPPEPSLITNIKGTLTDKSFWGTKNPPELKKGLGELMRNTHKKKIVNAIKETSMLLQIPFAVELIEQVLKRQSEYLLKFTEKNKSPELDMKPTSVSGIRG